MNKQLTIVHIHPFLDGEKEFNYTEQKEKERERNQ